MMPSKSQTVNYALVGCGLIGAAHLHGLQLLRDAGVDTFALRAVCDATRERAERFALIAAQFEGRKPSVYTDYREMLDKEPVEAINLCTVHDTHHRIGVDILQAGKHLLVEKPLALTIKAGRALIRTAAQCGKVLATAENYRRTPYFRMIKWALDQGILGKVHTVVLLDSSFGNLIIEDTDWRHLRNRCGAGMVTDRGIHHADLFEHFLGAIDEVYGVARILSPVRYTFDGDGRVQRSLECDAEDTCSGMIKFQTGAAGLWHVSAAGHGEFLDEMDWCLLGSKGSMRGGKVYQDDGRQFSKEQMIGRFFQSLQPEWKGKWFPRGVTDSFAIEQHDFFESILEGSSPEVDGTRGLRSMAVCYAFCESSITGEPIKVDDVESGRQGAFQSELDALLAL